MPHIITYTEEIEEHGYCQQRPSLYTGDKYLLEVEGKKRLRIVRSVHLDKYVWENVAQWSITIVEYFNDEYSLGTLIMNRGKTDQCEVPVFVASKMIGVLSCDKDKVQGELILPSSVNGITVRGVAEYGFYQCQQLTKVVFSPMVVIAYEYAFSESGLKDMAFNDEIVAMVHITAIDGCKALPKFDKIFDYSFFPGKYLMRGGSFFEEWEEKLRQSHFI